MTDSDVLVIIRRTRRHRRRRAAAERERIGARSRASPRARIGSVARGARRTPAEPVRRARSCRRSWSSATRPSGTTSRRWPASPARPGSSWRRTARRRWRRRIFALQLEAGAWGISVATVSQVVLCRAFGFAGSSSPTSSSTRPGSPGSSASWTAIPDFDVPVLRRLARRRARSSPMACGRRADAAGSRARPARRDGSGRRPDGLPHAWRRLSRSRGRRPPAGLPVVGVAGYEGGIGHEIDAARARPRARVPGADARRRGRAARRRRSCPRSRRDRS